MNKHLKILKIFAGSSVSAQMEYRANFIVQMISSLVAFVGALLGLSVLFGDDAGLGGWSLLEAQVLVGVFLLLEGLTEVLVYPNVRKIAEMVRTGTMDFTLLKPIDSQFSVSSRNVNVFAFPNVLLGFGLMVYALIKLGNVSWTGILLSIPMLLSALTIIYCICFILITTAFWFVKVENIIELFWGFFRAGQFPITAFPAGGARILFTYIVPIAFITTVPAQALIGKISLESVLASLGIASVLFVASRLFWKFALKSYTSASS